MSPSLAHAALLWFPAILTLLLLVFVAAIIRSPAWTPSPASPDADPLGPRQTGDEPPTVPLPRRVAGQSGRIARGPGELQFPPGVVRAPRVSGTPPWGPAPKPPGVP
jgi:hypothetical protein